MTVVLCTGVCAISFVRSLCLYDDCATVEGEAATMSAVPYAVSMHGGGSTGMDMSCSDVCGVVCPYEPACCVCAINHEHLYHEHDNVGRTYSCSCQQWLKRAVCDGGRAAVPVIAVEAVTSTTARSPLLCMP
jgi:hypothetical protein